MAVLEPEPYMDTGDGVEVRGEDGFEGWGDAEGPVGGQSSGPGVRCEFFGTAALGRGQRGELLEAEGGAAEVAGDIEGIAGAGAGAEEGAAFGNGADEDDIGEGEGRLGEVAAGEGRFVVVGEGEQAVVEAVHPGFLLGRALVGGGKGELAGQTEGEECGDGAGTHGGKVAEATGQGAVADGLRRVPVEVEVASGEAEVGSDGDLFAGVNAEEGAVVADAEREAGAGGTRGEGADAAEQIELAGGGLTS